MVRHTCPACRIVVRTEAVEDPHVACACRVTYVSEIEPEVES